VEPWRRHGGHSRGIGAAPSSKAASTQEAEYLVPVSWRVICFRRLWPQYPAIAKAARIQGNRSLTGYDFRRNGGIENLRVVRRSSNVAAGGSGCQFRAWRYKPYLLNGDPVEVETTVNVVFNLGG